MLNQVWFCEPPLEENEEFTAASYLGLLHYFGHPCCFLFSEYCRYTKDRPTQQKVLKVQGDWPVIDCERFIIFIQQLTANMSLPRYTSAYLHHNEYNSDHDERRLILKTDNGITVLESTAITILLPTPSVSSELFQILSKAGLCCGRSPPTEPVLWTVHWCLIQADRLTWANIKVCPIGTHKQHI